MFFIDWTDELIGRLRALNDAGMSTSRMALEVGGGMTKNAIIGKFRRLGIRLGKRQGMPVETNPVFVVEDAPAAVEVPAPESPVNPPVKRTRRSPFTGYGRVDIQAGAMTAIFDLGRSDCHWPIGDTASTEFRFCSEAALSDCPYCAAHTALSIGSGTFGERKATSGLNRRIG